MQLVDRPIRTTFLSASAQLAAGVVYVPELADIIMQNLDFLPLSEGWKTGIRVTLAIAAVLARPVKQRSISG